MEEGSIYDWLRMEFDIDPVFNVTGDDVINGTRTVTFTHRDDYDLSFDCIEDELGNWTQAITVEP